MFCGEKLACRFSNLVLHSARVCSLFREVRKCGPLFLFQPAYFHSVQLVIHYAAMRLGKILKGWRENQKLQLRTVADDIGISHGTLSRIENDKPCDSGTLMKLLLWLFS